MDHDLVPGELCAFCEVRAKDSDDFIGNAGRSWLCRRIITLAAWRRVKLCAGDTAQAWRDRTIRQWSHRRFGRKPPAQQAAVAEYLIGQLGRAQANFAAGRLPLSADARRGYLRHLQATLGRDGAARIGARTKRAPASTGMPESAAQGVRASDRAGPPRGAGKYCMAFSCQIDYRRLALS